MTLDCEDREQDDALLCSLMSRLMKSGTYWKCNLILNNGAIDCLFNPNTMPTHGAALTSALKSAARARKTGRQFIQNSSSQGVAVSELHSLPAKLFHTAPSSFLKQLQRGGSLLPEVRRPNSDADQRAGAEFPIRPSVGGEHRDCGAIRIILASILETTLSPSTTFALCGGFYPPRHSNCGFTLLQFLPPPPQRFLESRADWSASAHKRRKDVTCVRRWHAEAPSTRTGQREANANACN